MARYYVSKGHFWRDMSTRLVLIAISTAIIVLLLPHSGVPEYDYQVDKPWQYNQIIADSEIPLYKSDAQLKSERDSLMASFLPYYNRVEVVGDQAVARFLERYSTGIPGVPKTYVKFIANRLRQVYAMGILDAEARSRADKDSTAQIRLVSGNTATSVPVGQYMTPLSAYEWVFDSPVMAKERQHLQQCDINEYLEPNIIYDKDRTEVEQNDLLSSIPVASGLIQVGQKIIDRGEVVDAEDYVAISSYLKELKQRKASNTELISTYGGQTLFVALLLTMFTMYLLLYRYDYFEKPRSIAMLYAGVIIVPVLVSLVVRNHFFTVYVLPLCMLPMFVRVFMDSRTAFLTHVVAILASSIAVQMQFEFVAIELLGGLAAIFALRALTQRSQVFLAALIIGFVEIAVFEALLLIRTTNELNLGLPTVYHILSSAVLMLLSYPLMYLVEKAFGFVSAVTLFELSDMNKPLLRHLSEVAPGTFQHSITVGNLAAEIANRIGARATLVRTGALYHDIGKIRHPVFFTENQVGINPHKRLTELESAQVIISHVSEGLRLAEAENLPSMISDFIRTHHGAGMARYFYIQYKNNHPDEEVDEKLFAYPGPNPFTREQAILMMADTVEAASRSLQEYTEESISGLVNKLIDGQVQQGCFRDCPITFRDIALAKEVLVEKLKSIYHTRIAYPEIKK